MQALRRGGYEIEGPCNGQGICGKCRIRVENPAEVPQTPHRRISEIENREKGIRLACRLIPRAGRRTLTGACSSRGELGGPVRCARVR